MAISPRYIGEQSVQGVSKFGRMALGGTVFGNNVNIKGAGKGLFVQSKVVANDSFDRIPGDRRSDAFGDSNTEPLGRLGTISQHGNKIMMVNRLAAAF